MIDFHLFLRLSLLIEIAYTFIVCAASLYIYFKTREMHELTSHMGIKYFSSTFLFFFIAYFFRFFFRIFLRLIFDERALHFHPGFILGIAIFYFASMMAALYLSYSLVWKRFDHKVKSTGLLLSMIAVAATILSILLEMPALIILFITGLFLFSAVLSIYRHARERKKHPFHIAYILIFLVWLLDMLSLEIPMFMLELKAAIYLAACVLFLVILWGVLRRAK